MNKERLRHFEFPFSIQLPKAFRIHVHRSQFEYVYWEFLPDRGWTVLCEIFPDDGPKTPCLHFESDKAWNALYEMAKNFGYEDEPCLT